MYLFKKHQVFQTSIYEHNFHRMLINVCVHFGMSKVNKLCRKRYFFTISFISFGKYLDFALKNIINLL